MPLGFSPISPVLCAPTGLKYLNIIIDKFLSETFNPSSICSDINFVPPYGFVKDLFDVSFAGILSGFPYTVALDENIILLTLYFFIISNILRNPIKLF